MRKGMERWKAASIPHRFLASIIYQLVPLAVLEYGGGAEDLSLSFFLMYIGLMMGNITWTRALAPKGRHSAGIALGHLSLILPSLTILARDVNAALLSSFLISFLSPISYFAGLFYAYNELKDPSKASAGYESISGWSWFIGLVFGGISLSILTIDQLAMAAIFLDIAAFPVLTAVLSIPVRSVLKRAYEEEIGILPIIEEGLNAISKAEEEALEWTMAMVHRVTRGTLFQKPAYISIGKPHLHAPFNMKVFLGFIGLGLAYPQLVGLEKSMGLTNSHIYMLSALSSFISSLFYSRAGRGDEVRNLDISFIVRGILLLSVPALTIGLVAPLEYFVVFMVLDGMTWSYILVSISRRGLNESLEYLGAINFVRSLGWSIGALVGGFIVELIGLELLYSISSAIVLLGALIGVKEARAGRIGGLVPPD